MQGSCVPANGKRFTPACAGKSEHGHDDEPDDQESPPRARGRVFRMVLLFTAIGITPACAGKRMTAWLLQSLPAESPPRARGRDDRPFAGLRLLGITPACAGKRTLSPGSSDRGWESPPRARGRVAAAEKKAWSGRITPACAGKRGLAGSTSGRLRNHPRVRGEEQPNAALLHHDGESPPRARGRDDGPLACRLLLGITPACAGKRVMKMRPSRVWAYPLSANFSFFFGTSFECRAIPERGARRLFGCQASGLATCYASRIQEQTIGCFTGVHCLYPTSRSLRNGTEYNRAES